MAGSWIGENGILQNLEKGHLGREYQKNLPEESDIQAETKKRGRE